MEKLENLASFIKEDIVTAKIYSYILKNAPVCITELNNKDLCCNDINTRLKKLSDMCLISDFVGRDGMITYFPIDPQYALPSIVISEMWKNDVNLHTIDELYRRDGLDELKELQSLCISLLKWINPIYNKRLMFLKEMAVVIKGKHKIATYLCELLNGADKVIRAVVSPPHLLGEIVWQTVCEKMKNGVEYHRITIGDELLRHGFTIYKNEITNFNEKLYICKSKKLSHKFYIIDNKTVIFFIPDVKTSEFKMEAQIINNEGFVKRYLDVYEKLKGESIDLDCILEKFENHRQDYINSASKILTNEELKWLISVYDYGVFCEHHKFSIEIVNSATEKCLSNNLIKLTDKGEFYINLDVKEILQND
ncbi:MAG TPA: hypothetical protein VEF53_02550 [Patescibacteria group bacterium]|nr:hypothetical protein [Patescibacteria group bacterium]